MLRCPSGGCSHVAKRAGRAAVVVVLVGGLIVLVTQDLTSPADVRSAVEGAPAAAPLIFVTVYATFTLLLIPGAIGSTAAGVLFGAAWGTVLTLLGATAGATAAFLVARWLGRERVERLTDGKIARLDRWLSNRGLGAVLFLRLVPLFPFNVVNYGAGLTGLPLGTYVAGTAIGIVPGTVAYVGLGAGLDDPGSPRFLASLGLLGVLAAAGFIALRLTPERTDGSEEHPADCRAGRHHPGHDGRK